MKIKFSDLSFPKGLNLEILSELLTEDSLQMLIALSAKKDRKSRRIILPSQRCLKKVFCHYIWEKIDSGDPTWKQWKRAIKDEFGLLKNLDFTKWDCKKLWEVRKIEIERENK